MLRGATTPLPLFPSDAKQNHVKTISNIPVTTTRNPEVASNPSPACAANDSLSLLPRFNTKPKSFHESTTHGTRIAVSALAYHFTARLQDRLLFTPATASRRLFLGKPR